ncbi:TrbL/VirB6 plasmid conjugal transfer protein [Sporomusa acidovorans]|nr:peptidoglycan DD-metalloendopeptidase family protein [Sporomusa acidovorans]OZC19043.1 murein DD-endopeptidase MepM [Sporomusa acidovorans DSM 3132]SDD73995.1 TrbL/VirB6 plasmid conjugal transfer protein [Sporomusa acidovorans]
MIKAAFARKLLRSFFLLAFLFTVPCLAYANLAMQYPVAAPKTSDFGWRLHPVYGTPRLHAGVDLGTAEGSAVHTAAAGTVEYSGWISGYGYYILINHGQDDSGRTIRTGYAHLSNLAGSFAGKQVEPGELIAYSGSTGTVSGDCLHFEVRVGNSTGYGGLTGEVVNPEDYLGGLPASSGSEGDAEELFVPVDFSIFYDFALPLRDMVEKMAAACIQGLKLLQQEMLTLFICLITMDLALAFLWSMFRQESAQGMFEFLLHKSVFYGMLLFFLQNWGTLIDLVKQYFVSSAALMFQKDMETALEAVSDPSAVIQQGMQLTAPYFNYIESFHSPIAIFFNKGLIAIVFLLGILTVAIFLFMGIQIMLAYMEFYLMGVCSVVSVTLAGFRYTSDLPLANFGINGLFASAIKLMWMTFFAMFLSLMVQIIPQDGLITNHTGTQDMTLDQFMEVIGDIESGGDYAEPANAYGARGKYQILESNWDAWCEEAGLPAGSEWTPANQDRVARYKMLEYYESYGDWREVAIAWNAGAAWVGSSVLPEETVNYLEKLEEKGGGSSATFDIVLAVERFFFVLLTAIIGSRVSGVILRTFSGEGFSWRST